MAFIGSGDRHHRGDGEEASGLGSHSKRLPTGAAARARRLDDPTEKIPRGYRSSNIISQKRASSFFQHTFLLFIWLPFFHAVERSHLSRETEVFRGWLRGGSFGRGCAHIHASLAPLSHRSLVLAGELDNSKGQRAVACGEKSVNVAAAGVLAFLPTQDAEEAGGG